MTYILSSLDYPTIEVLVWYNGPYLVFFVVPYLILLKFVTLKLCAFANVPRKVGINLRML